MSKFTEENCFSFFQVIQLLDKLKEEREGIKGQDEKKKRQSKKSDEPEEEVFWDDEELDDDGAFI